jgi:hypothetical protein
VRLLSRTLEVRIETRADVVAPVAAPATLTHDVHRCYGTWASGGTCRIRIFEAESRPPVVLCTQIESTPGAGIHAFAEFLAPSIIGTYLPHRFDDPIPAVWIEQTSDDLARVTFATWKPTIQYHPSGWRTNIGKPTRTPITSTDLKALIGNDADRGL